ncbi:MAG TPA: phage tail protein [Verrucomicrobiota bacterium]|nr:hypothetical protein [Verrucomicrobiales bacterium]HRI11531.1 phage tail protein [Verrucomicrobiota bacterium]
MKIMKGICGRALCSALLTTAFVLAQPAPKLLPFQGRLTDPNGVAVHDGVRLIQFKMFDEPSGGPPKWSGELHRTTVNGGLVNVLLGSKTPLTGVDFDRQIYLEITVDINTDNAITAADPPMLPRQVLLPVVFAKEAAQARDSHNLAGHDWAALLDRNDPVNGRLLGSKISDGTLPAAAIGDGALPGSKITDATIAAEKLVPASVGTEQLAAGAVTAEKIDTAAMELLAPPGTVSAYMGTNDPPGWLICDGRLLPKGEYGRLYSVIGGIAGTPSDTTQFRLPDLRGFFLRGANRGREDGYRDPDVDRRFAHPGEPNDAPGSWQDDAFQAHNHKVYFPEAVAERVTSSRLSPGSADSAVLPNPFVRNDAAAELYAAEELPPARTSTESRPKNVYVNYIIRY